MRWDFGQVYQKIRKSKGISQSQAAGNFCSRGHLSNIEKNKDIPSYELMEHLLRQIDMTFGEFEHICNYYKPSKRKNILLKISKHSSAINIDDLKEIAQLCEEYLKEVEDLPIQNVLNLVRVFIEIRTNGPSEKANELADIIWQDLQKRDAWYANDLRMLGAILYFFNFETIQETTDKILDSLARYRDYMDLQKVHFSILSNLATIYLRNNHKNKCLELSQQALELALEQKRYDQLGFSQIRIGICTKDKVLIDKGRQLLELTNETTLLHQLQKEIQDYSSKV